jgi:hypothetical protein
MSAIFSVQVPETPPASDIILKGEIYINSGITDRVMGTVDRVMGTVDRFLLMHILIMVLITFFGYCSTHGTASGVSGGQMLGVIAGVIIAFLIACTFLPITNQYPYSQAKAVAAVSQK